MTVVASSDPAALGGAWWTFLLRGLVGIALGIGALIYPAATLGALVILLAAYFLVDGAFAVVKAFSLIRVDRHWWVVLLAGIVSIVAGAIAFIYPGLTIYALAILVAWWAIFTGALEIVAGIRLRKVIEHEWLYIMFGTISVVFGAFVLYLPTLGLTYIIIMTSFYGFMSGFIMLGLAMRVRSLPRAMTGS